MEKASSLHQGRISEGRTWAKNTPVSGWIYRIIIFVYAGLFLYSGFSKLLDPESFASVIDAFGIVPESMTLPIAIGLPVLEVAAALGLLLDVRGSLAVISGLLLIFLAVLGYGIWLGLDIDCGCFGPDDPESEAYSGLRTALYRDLILIAGVAYLYSMRSNGCWTMISFLGFFKGHLGLRKAKSLALLDRMEQEKAPF